MAKVPRKIIAYVPDEMWTAFAGLSRLQNKSQADLFGDMVRREAARVGVSLTKLEKQEVNPDGDRSTVG